MARPQLTILDYLVVAICPILIGLMVGSFAYFMLECTYVGVHNGTVRFITGCFIVATVGIARISIEMSKGRAIVYGAFLLFVVILAVDHLSSDSVPVFFMIVALTWFGIHKLTWSCTFIDEQEEDVGRGFLEREASEASSGSKTPVASKTSETLKKRDASQASDATKKPDAPKAWYAAKKGSSAPEASEPEEEEPAEEPAAKPSRLRRAYTRIASFLSEKEKRTHPPGVWIIYFGIVAIPLFTIAQWMIPPEQQERAIGYVTVCLFTGMCLLVATSLLGLRRYLRHRNVPMSGLTSTAWVTLGGILIVVCVGFAMLMPRPTGTVSERMAALRESFTFKEKPTEASRHAQSRDAADENPDRLEGQGKNRDSSGEPGKASKHPKDGSPKGTEGASSTGSKEPSSDNQQSSGQGQKSTDQGQKSGDGKEGSKGGQESDQKEAGDRSTSTDSTPRHTSTPPPPRGLSLAKGLVLLRWVALAVIVLIIGFAVWRNWRELINALREIIQSIRDFFANLFGGAASPEKKELKRRRAKARKEAESRVRFIDMADPFSTGQAAQMRPQELVKYTFEAIETWAVDRDAARGEDETPREFLLRVEQKTQIPADSLRTLSEAYARTTYDMLPETDQTRATLLNHLGTIWRSMRGGIVS